MSADLGHGGAFTPGPWMAVGGLVQQYEIRDGEKLTGLYVADCRMTDEGAINARLIAAAPDLLAALEACVKELEAVRDGSIGGIPNDIALLIPERIDQAKAALTKARGASHG